MRLQNYRGIGRKTTPKFDGSLGTKRAIESTDVGTLADGVGEDVVHQTLLDAEWFA